jgi:hypothetical protein
VRTLQYCRTHAGLEGIAPAGQMSAYRNDPSNSAGALTKSRFTERLGGTFGSFESFGSFGSFGGIRSVVRVMFSSDSDSDSERFERAANVPNTSNDPSDPNELHLETPLIATKCAAAITN